MEVVIFTARYPYGKGETFLESEIRVWKNEGWNVVLVPLLCVGAPRDSFDKTWAEVVCLPERNSPFKVLSWIQRFRILLKEYINGNTSISTWRMHLSLLRKAELRASAFINWQLVRSNSSSRLYYSYWFDEWATTLSILRLKGHISEFISRVHGYDLFHERSVDGFIPLRNFQLEQASVVYSVSKTGCNYLRELYPEMRDKLSYSYLGTSHYKQTGDKDKVKYMSKMHIVSCSSVRDLKRVDRIYEAIKSIDDVTWTHLGGGEGLSRLKERVRREEQDKSTRVKLLGDVTNTYIHDFYANVKIDCFVNASTSEGLPVSIMEAISHGIPVVATDVGGTSEIVNEHTGMLIAADFDLEHMVNAIYQVVDRFDSEIARKKIVNYWRKNFRDEHNYRHFVNRVSKYQSMFYP